MPNLDVKALRYMCADEFRVLTAVEMGMKNHELVPTPLIESISGLKRGGAFKYVKLLCKNKLVAHQSKPYDSYRLTFKGYDYLAIKTMSKRGTLASMGIQIGVGKESDIFTVCNQEGDEVCIKLHRLGRNCFRTVKTNRDYLRPNQSASWLYLSRLSALKEYSFMSALHAKGFPVPQPLDVNRHCVVMSLSMGFQLNSIQELRHPGKVFGKLMQLICRLASYGLIHCDFNEFNLLVDDEEHVTLIDFPQMVSTSHPNAEYYFDRDVECVRTFFRRRFGFVADAVPNFTADVKREHNLDVDLAASGWTSAANLDFERLQSLYADGAAEAADDDVAADDAPADGAEGLDDEEEEQAGAAQRAGEVDGRGGESGGCGSGGLVVLAEEGSGAREEAADDDVALRELEESASRLWSTAPIVISSPSEIPISSPSEIPISSPSEQRTHRDGSGVGSALLEGRECDGAIGSDGTQQGVRSSRDGAASCAKASEGVPERMEARSGEAEAVRAGRAGEGGADEGDSEPSAAARPRMPRGAPCASDPLVAERVKRELRRKKSARPEGKASRNEHKDREKRKLAATTKREASGFSGW
eukprot:CAMPEP_0119398156 /NCGR_PEP_ID=MMETSP1334-20130426/140701_1 /TAXON_ID=127549 /ORGANISM="Calcidiscus leptoporus, Strain RCC1130" /LENGTH=585 /DNA_ID=CAMNT_0007422013 /DNA_START=182 /DNA_END=1939 /DNA_ORIENTATION=+